MTALTPYQRQLVQDHLRNAEITTRKHMRRNRRLRGFYEDLLQEARIGLVIAASKFDPNRGVRFITYALPWMMQRLYFGSGELASPVRDRSNNGRRWVETGDMPEDVTDPTDYGAQSTASRDVRAILPGLVDHLVLAHEAKKSGRRQGLRATDRDRFAESRLRNVEVFLQGRFGDPARLNERYGISRELIRTIRDRLGPAFDEYAAELRAEAA